MAELEVLSFLFGLRYISHLGGLIYFFFTVIICCAYHLIAWFLTSKMDNGTSSQARCDP